MTDMTNMATTVAKALLPTSILGHSILWAVGIA
jgi:hypothetical protein